MVILGYLFLLFMGLTLGLVGAGGAILTIPIMIYIFKIPIIQATTYSLFVVGSTALMGVYHHRKFIELEKSLIFAIPSTFGVFLSRHIFLPHLPPALGPFQLSNLITFAFILLMGSAAFLMIKDFKPMTQLKQKLLPLDFIKLMTMAFVLGIVMGMLGAGGGFVIIPVLVLLLGFEIKHAVGTSLFIIFLNSTVGFLSDKNPLLTSDYQMLLSFVLMAGLGMAIGSYYNNKVSDVHLKKLFGWLVALVAFGMAVKELFY